MEGLQGLLTTTANSRRYCINPAEVELPAAIGLPLGR